MGIEWTKEAYVAANNVFLYSNNESIAAKIAAALDAACEVQGLETIGYRASQKSFESGRKIGRVEALEEAAKVAKGEEFGWSEHYKTFLYRRWPWRCEGSSLAQAPETVLADEIVTAIYALKDKPHEP